MTDATQPGLRSFIVYDELPAGCIAHEVGTETAAPHIRRGEFAVIDPADREPMHGELFLIQWSAGAPQLVEAVHRKGRYGVGPDDATIETRLWFADVRKPMVNLAGEVGAIGRWTDGPYRSEHFREKLMGRVVGIYQPDFRTALEGRAA